MHRAYIAGFLDGEGSIRLRVRAGRPTDPTVEIVNTDRATLEAIAAEMGVGRVERRRGVHLGHRAQWRLRIEGIQRVKRFLVPLIPYLLQKRERAVLAIGR